MSTLILIAGIFLFLLTLSAYMPLSLLATDTLSHFILQYAVAAVILTIIAVFMRMQLHIFVPLALALILAGIQLVPLIPIQSGAPKIAGKPFKILQANVHKLNTDSLLLQKLIRDESPDIIALAEVTSVFKPLLNELKTSYPYQEVVADDETSFGIALLSKAPMKNIHLHHFARAHVPAIEAEIMIGDETATFLAIHPYNPLSDFEARDAEFAEISRLFSARNQKLIIAGDFNATPYCTAFKRLNDHLSLQHARRDNGIIGTYPAWLPYEFLRLPIDHVMAGSAYQIVAHRLGADIGSDHLPTITVLGWKD